MKKIALVGSGPAMLMAAQVLSEGGQEVHLFEKRKGIGWKLLVAGSSGLNVGNDLELEIFLSAIKANHKELLAKPLHTFFTKDWIKFLETNLNTKVFLGSSRRYLVNDKTSAALLKIWKENLSKNGVKFYLDHELIDFEDSLNRKKVILSFQQISEEFDFVVLGLGGGSWESTPVSWPEIFQKKGMIVHPFESSNVGWEINWKDEFLKESLRQPLKDIVLATTKGIKRGDLLITDYGLEGTPIYFMGVQGKCFLDLKPSLSLEKIMEKLQCYSSKTKIKSSMKLVKKYLNLGDTSLSLIYHYASDETKADYHLMAQFMKKFPLDLLRPRPLVEAISSKGGLDLKELNFDYSLKKFPKIFVAGEMLDWDAPTGGYLIMTCVAQGYYLSKKLLHSHT